MPIKGIQRKRQPWVKPAAGVLAAAIAVYEAFRHEWLFMLIALVVLLIVRAICRKRKNKQDPNKNNPPANSVPWKLPEKKTEDDHGKKE